MITIDWKVRFNNDVELFFKKRLPQKDFDVSIIYNVYPVRINRKIPDEVIVFIANALAKRLIKNKQEYFDFYSYLWKKKGDNGKLFCSTLFFVFLKEDISFFFEIEKEYIKNIDDEYLPYILNISLRGLLKNDLVKIENIIRALIAMNRKLIDTKILKLLIKDIKKDIDIIDFIFDKLVEDWSKLSTGGITLFSKLMKQVYTLSPEKYTHIFKKLSSTVEPEEIEVLCLSVTAKMDFDKIVETKLLQWCKSGNNRVKKCAIAAKNRIKR